jgi:hypothetical protein
MKEGIMNDGWGGFARWSSVLDAGGFSSEEEMSMDFQI